MVGQRFICILGSFTAIIVAIAWVALDQPPAPSAAGIRLEKPAHSVSSAQANMVTSTTYSVTATPHGAKELQQPIISALGEHS